MEKIPNHIDESLLQYLDGTLPEKEAAEVEVRLQNDDALRNRLETLRVLDANLSRTQLEIPSRNFTQKVMEGLFQVPVRKSLSLKNGILLILGVLTVVALLTMLVSTGTFDNTEVIQPDTIGIKDNYFNFKIPSISINGKLVINSLIILNLAIALLVLDRTILRPLFERRFN